MPLEMPGLWVDVLQPPAGPGWPALFVDRDGTLMRDTGYLSDPAHIDLIPAILPALRQATQVGLPTVIVSNQSGVARGMFGWPEVEAVMAALTTRLAGEGVGLAAILACGYYPSANPELDIPDHPMRKPRGGMLRRAGDLLGLDLSRSLVVGDKPSDVLAGADAGLRSGFLVGGGEVRRLPPDFRCTAINDAAGWSALETAVRAAAPPRSSAVAT